MSRVVQRGQPHKHDSGGGMQMDYRYQQMSECTRIAIPAHYTDEDVVHWKQRLGEHMDRVFEEIWSQLSDEVKNSINKECAKDKAVNNL